jgi:hypothetical protein
MTTLPKNLPFYGGRQVPNPSNVKYTSGAPSTVLTQDPIGTLAFSSAGNVYGLVTKTGGVNTWAILGGATGAVATINSLSPTAGNIIIAGTANQVTVASAVSTVTLSLPSALTAPGSITATTSFTATAGDITATLGNVIINGAAKQLRVHGGAVTDFIGQATLTSGTVTVLNTNIAATDRIFVNRSAVNGSTALGVFKVVISAATNFVITACKPADGTTETNDASTVDYFIVRQV